MKLERHDIETYKSIIGYSLYAKIAKHGDIFRGTLGSNNAFFTKSYMEWLGSLPKDRYSYHNACIDVAIKEMFSEEGH